MFCAGKQSQEKATLEEKIIHVPVGQGYEA